MGVIFVSMLYFIGKEKGLRVLERDWEESIN